MTDPLVGITPTVIEVALTLATLFYYLISWAIGGGAIDVANIFGPASLSLIVAYATYRALILNRHNLWSPLIWYRVAVFGYFGIGSLIPLFLNDVTRRIIESFFEFFAIDVLKFNMVVTLFHTAMLVTMWIILSIAGRTKLGEKGLRFITPCNLSAKDIGIVFTAAGLAINYLLVYPASIGITNIHIPNILLQVSQLAYVGYFLISYWAFQDKRYHILWLVFFLSLADSAFGVVQLTKLGAIFPVLMLPIAYLYYKISLKRLLLIVALTVPYYFVVGGVITDARLMVSRTIDGEPDRADSVEVLTALLKGEDSPDMRTDDFQITWARLSYVNAGAFAISQYDNGLPGNSLRDALIVWIPRAIYPDKPIITNLGREFTQLATGDDRSSTSPSIPAEAYWVYGWGGVILFAFITAVILSLWSIYNATAVHREAWHLLLVVVLGMRCGSRIDGVLVVDMIGPISAAVFLHIMLFFVNRLLPSRETA